MKARAVVTGLGIVSPIGIGISEFWKSALDGRSGISAISGFDPFPMDGYRSKVAGQVREFSPERYLEPQYADRIDRYAQFALVAAKEALTDSGMTMTKENPHRVGVIVGAGMGGMVMGEREITQLYQQQRPHRVHPNFIPVITLNSASGIVAMATGAKGPNVTISTACSSSAHALGQALHCIREGRADAVIVVGADASITPLVFAGFCSLRALSTKYNDQPEKASRPFDLGRDGFHGRGSRRPHRGVAGPCQKTQGQDLRRSRRVRRHERGLSHGDSARGRRGSRHNHAPGLGGCGSHHRSSRLRQCPRHVDFDR